MNNILSTDKFNKWFDTLKDKRLRNNILARLRRLTLNDFGDCKSIIRGLQEMRIHYGKGVRIYFFKNGETLYILLGGGTKATQQTDIMRALSLMDAIKEEKQ